MFDEVRRAVAAIDPDGIDPDSVAELCALADALDERLNAVVDRVDRDRVAANAGAASTTAWLKHTTRRSGSAAARHVRTARKLRMLPVVREAWRSGELSSAHVDAIVANVTDAQLDRFAEQEAELVGHLALLHVDEAQKAMRWWALLAADADDTDLHDDDQRPRPPDQLWLARTLDDHGVLKGTLGPDTATIVETALARFGLDDPAVPADQRRAEALAAVCQFALDNHDKTTTRRNRPHIAVLLLEGADGQPVAESLSGRPVSPSRLRQWLCDCLVRRILTTGSRIIDYGYDTPVIPPALWHLVAERDRTCRWPGCDRPVAWCEAHHVVPFPDGPTSIENLALFCSCHHHRLHDNSGWTATLHPDGQLDVTAPDGTVQTTFPPYHPQRLALLPPIVADRHADESEHAEAPQRADGGADGSDGEPPPGAGVPPPDADRHPPGPPGGGSHDDDASGPDPP